MQTEEAHVTRRGMTATSLLTRLAGNLHSLQGSLARAHPVMLIAAVAWVANFLHFTSFGYYEDDWFFYAPAFGHSYLSRFQAVLPLMTKVVQGRFIGQGLETLFACAGRYSTTLPYLAIYSLLATTAILFYYVLRMRFPRFFCTLAAVLFVLSPLTTVREELVIEGVIGPAFVLVLAAMLLRRRRPLAAYVLATLSLFTYESVFFLFLAAPLFERGRLRGRKLRATGKHLAICFGALVGTLLLRRLFGEERVMSATSAGDGSLLGRAMGLYLYIPYFAGRSFLTYGYAAWVSWRERPLEPLIYLAAFALWVRLLWRNAAFRMGKTAGRLQPARRTWWLWNGCIFSLGVLGLGYLTIYLQVLPWWVIFFAGRDTRFAASAVPGSSMFWASLIALLAAVTGRRFRWLAGAVATCLVSVLFVYSFVIQDDYVRAWDYQKSFYSQLVQLTPDLESHGVVVVRTGANPQPGYGPNYRPGSVGWERFGMAISLKAMAGEPLFYASSRPNPTPEILFSIWDDLRPHFAAAGGVLHWTPRDPASLAEPIFPGRVIILNERADGLLFRSDEQIVVDGKPVVAPAEAAGDDTAWKTIRASGLLDTMITAGARNSMRR